MKHFRRALPYVFMYWRSVLALVLCALLAATLYSTTLVSMLPLMKVMINEEGLHGWVYRGIIKHRSGVEFQSAQVLEDSSGNIIDFPLQPAKIDPLSEAAQSGLLLNEVVTGVQIGDGEVVYGTRAELLRLIAEAPDEAAVVLTVEPAGVENAEPRAVVLPMEARPFYADTAFWLLGKVPRDQSSDFREKSILLIILILLIATLLRCAFTFVHGYLVSKVSFSSMMHLRQDMYHNVVRFPLGHFSSEGTSDTTSRFVQDTIYIMTGVMTILGKAVMEPFKIIMLLVMAMTINWQMTLIVMLAAPPAGWVFHTLGRKIKRATRRHLESWSLMIEHLRDSLQGLRVVKGYHREEFEEVKFGAIHRALLRQQLRIGKIDALSGPLLESLGIGAACAGMVFAVQWIMDGQMEPSKFFVIVFLLASIADSGRKLSNVYPRMQTADAASQRVFNMLDMPQEREVANAKVLGPLSRSLEIRDLSFSYPDSDVEVLRNVNLTVDAGQTVAVVGPNGSGKSTLLNLIPRFYSPTKGAIYIDGQNIADVTFASLREQIGIVPQRTITFNDTILANIAYGDINASEEAVIAAAKSAYAHEFITQTTKGYQTIVGEQGVTLSGGQLQRLAIARAILRDPAILIFDEATSQIDSDSEAKIQKALSDFAKNRTSFIIAHRLSTVIDSDMIVVLNEGEIIAQGTHKELLDSCRLYRQLYEMQFGALSNI
ncbi:MAG: ABC transporter ATP-binding protein [Sedimentisphaerales bacterium]|nr:ABC transporter ATP-binding protein [Sedimentisphaerales bacterium]